MRSLVQLNQNDNDYAETFFVILKQTIWKTSPNSLKSIDVVIFHFFELIIQPVVMQCYQKWSFSSFFYAKKNLLIFLEFCFGENEKSLQSWRYVLTDLRCVFEPFSTFWNISNFIAILSWWKWRHHVYLDDNKKEDRTKWDMKAYNYHISAVSGPIESKWQWLLSNFFRHSKTNNLENFSQ